MAETLEEIRRSARRCRDCPLWANATQAVFGAGDPHARVILVGEQPGDEEDRKGLPFIGPAGRQVRLPDGTDRFVVDESMLVRLTDRLGGRLADPIKTTNVQGKRCMTTWCVIKG